MTEEEFNNLKNGDEIIAPSGNIYSVFLVENDWRFEKFKSCIPLMSTNKENSFLVQKEIILHDFCLHKTHSDNSGNCFCPCHNCWCACNDGKKKDLEHAKSVMATQEDIIKKLSKANDELRKENEINRHLYTEIAEKLKEELEEIKIHQKKLGGLIALGRLYDAIRT